MNDQNNNRNQKERAEDSKQIVSSLSIESSNRETIIVELKITNIQPQNIFQLDPIIAGPNISNNFFQIQNFSGKLIEYQGMMKKRRAPEESSFIYIKPNESYKTKFEINNRSYNLSKKGNYKIKLETPNHFSKDFITIESEWVKFSID